MHCMPAPATASRTPAFDGAARRHASTLNGLGGMRAAKTISEQKEGFEGKRTFLWPSLWTHTTDRNSTRKDVNTWSYEVLSIA